MEALVQAIQVIGDRSPLCGGIAQRIPLSAAIESYSDQFQGSGCWAGRLIRWQASVWALIDIRISKFAQSQMCTITSQHCMTSSVSAPPDCTYLVCGASHSVKPQAAAPVAASLQMNDAMQECSPQYMGRVTTHLEVDL